MMMSLIVRYGEQNILTEDAEGNPLQLPLINYVYEDLSADELSLHTPIYSKMLNEAILHITDPDFQSSRYFLNNPDLDISREAANLMTDRYQLSKGQHMLSEQELMPEYITHLLLDYKFLVIDDEMKKCQQDMNDPLLCTDAMHKYMQLSNIQRQLGKRLGDRIIMN